MPKKILKNLFVIEYVLNKKISNIIIIIILWKWGRIWKFISNHNIMISMENTFLKYSKWNYFVEIILYISKFAFQIRKVNKSNLI